MSARDRFQLACDSLGEEEIEAVISVLRSGRYTMGTAVAEFEAAIAQWTGARHAIMVNSGSSANLLLVDSLLRRSHREQIKLIPGDEVLVPALAWPTTVWPIVQLGLVPVYVDVDPETLAISLEAAAELLGSRTRAMFLIHALGRACDGESYIGFCRRHGLVLIEDCCESFGAYHSGRHVGLSGLGGTLSHYYSHHLTTIEGGTILTDDQELCDDLKSLRAHGWVRDRSDRAAIVKQYPEFDARFLFLLPGYNVRPMDLQGAIGLVQLARMDEYMIARESLARHVLDLNRRFASWMRMYGAESLELASTQRQARNHSWMMIAFNVPADAPMTVGQVKAVMEQNGVETRPIIAGNLARHPAASYGPRRMQPLMPVADDLLEHGFMIGCHPTPTAKSLECLARAFAALQRQ